MSLEYCLSHFLPKHIFHKNVESSNIKSPIVFINFEPDEDR